jgi:mannose-6-phosphate isomerase-like protein (cupin superfamily)
MIIPRAEHPAKRVVDCHHGQGVLWCTELLADYKKAGSGFKYLHDNVLDPGASIGEHVHTGDEEIYVILTGRGQMKIDGVVRDVGPGDVCLTRGGHRHDLTNGLEGPMHFLVVCANL